MRKKIKSIEVKFWLDGEEKHYAIRGKRAMTLHALACAGKHGITALELCNTWALRLSEYKRSLLHDYGLDIVMVREEHDDGWHGRYVLHTPVEITNIKHK